MIHVTMNTGHSMEVPPGKVGRQALRLLKHLVVKGGGRVPGMERWRTVVSRGDGAAVFDIRRSDSAESAVVLNAVAWSEQGEAIVWELLERSYYEVGDILAKIGVEGEAPDLPDRRPWLATWILPQAMFLAGEQDFSWFADFEQCMALAILERWGDE